MQQLQFAGMGIAGQYYELSKNGRVWARRLPVLLTGLTAEIEVPEEMANPGSLPGVGAEIKVEGTVGVDFNGNTQLQLKKAETIKK